MPPVSVILLATSATHNINKVIKIPQNTYARILAAPRAAAIIAGNTNIPDPITVLIILELSP